MRRIVGLAVVSVFLFMAAPARAATFTMDQVAFLAANPSLTFLDFESLAAGCPVHCATTPIAFLPTLSFSGSSPQTAGPGLVAGYPSTHIFLNSIGGFLRMGFAPTVTAVGFNLSKALFK